MGFYEFFVNGKEITKGKLAPYISNPDQVVYYDKYDLTDLLKQGKNAFGFILGNGFLNNPAGSGWLFDQGSFRSAPKLALTFIVDGKVVFEADKIGHLEISGEIFGEAAEQSLVFRFEVDQTCLKDFIQTIKMYIE